AVSRRPGTRIRAQSQVSFRIVLHLSLSGSPTREAAPGRLLLDDVPPTRRQQPATCRGAVSRRSHSERATAHLRVARVRCYVRTARRGPSTGGRGGVPYPWSARGGRDDTASPHRAT